MAYLDRSKRITLSKLSETPRFQDVTVRSVESDRKGDPVATRLRDLGFVDGEPVRIVARTPFGGESLVVQVGFTRFALRRAEAARIMVSAAEDQLARR